MKDVESVRVWRTGLYLRLSRDDERGAESQSITNQRAILAEYARRNGLEVVDEYVDDGWSGTNYDRPAFRRMIGDVESGRIDCVAVKDLSRLGRNSARTADLLDEYFPARGVRCISVVDGYDSLHLTGGMAMTTPLVAAMHEVYARDISCKIRASFRAKMEEGRFIGSFAPYGYRKDPADRNRLLPDPDAAEVVREIFRAAAEGIAPGEIAAGLNGRGVAPPLAYRRTGRLYGGEGEWTSSGICKLLRNRVYLGCTVQGKTGKPSFKSKAPRPRPPEEWVAVEGTHQALVDGETFRLARAWSAARRKKGGGGFENVFSGVARCAQCGSAMTPASSRKKGSPGNLCCGRYKAHGSAACGSHAVDYALLYEAVLGELRGQLAALGPADRAALARELEAVSPDPAAQRERARLEARRREVAALQKRLYEDRAFGRVAEGLYEELSAGYEAERARLERASEALAARREPPGGMEALEEALELRELTRPIVRRLIERIEVEQGTYAGGRRTKEQRLRIYYRFAPP